MTNKTVIESLENFSKVTPTFDNMEELISIKGFFPIQSNTNVDEKTNTIAWAQLVVSYKSSYGRVDDVTGEHISDNATHKKLVVKFPRKYLEINRITTNEFKSFFDTHFVKKSRLILPVTEEKQSFRDKLPILNQSEVTISDTFNLRSFIDSFKKAK